MNQFNEKVIIITGGGAGIGKALCMEMAKFGAVVFVADINEDNAEQVASFIIKGGGKAHSVRVDVSKEKEVKNLIDEAVAKYGRLDYIFNNAGIAIGGDVRDLTAEQWQKVLNVDLYGCLYGSIYAYRIMAKQGFGHIVNTASGTGLLPQPGNAPYCTCKHGVVGLSLSLRYEGADLGIKVSTICPGRVKTDIFKSSTVVNVSDEYVTDKISVKAMEVSEAVNIILKGVSRNKSIIIFPFSVRLVWYLNRWFPGLLEPVWVKAMRNLRKYRKKV